MSGSAGFADSNRASIRYIIEDPNCWGDTPTSGITRALRFTSSSLAASKETVVSDELRADRMVSSVIEVSAASNGEINFEFSAGSHDDFLQAFMLGAWTRPMTFDFFKGTTVSFTATNEITISGQDVSDYFVVGRYVKTEGFLTEGNNAYWEISAIAFGGTDTVLTLVETSATIEGSSDFTKVMDANDVFVANNTDIRLGTGGAAEIDSNGNNAFASVVAAGQIEVGQKIYVDLPVGAETFRNQTITLSGAMAAADQIQINDGTEVLSLFGGTDFVVGVDANTDAAALAEAINKERRAGRLDVKATVAAAVVTVYFLSNSAVAEVTDPVDAGGVVALGVATAATDANARGVYTVVSASDDVIGVSPTPPTIATPGAVTIKGSMLRNPGDVDDITAQSFSLETSFNDVDKTFLQDGMRVGSFSMDVSTGAIVTGTMNFEGKETIPLTSEQLNDAVTYEVLDTTATEVMNATTNVGALTKNGSELATAVQSLSMEGDASLRQQMAVGSKFARGIGTGRFNLTGNITAYFETLEMYQHFIDHDTISLGWDFTDADKNVYYFTIPAVKITADPIAPTGIDEDVTEEMEWSAFRDPATKCMLQVDRFSSVRPS